MNGDFFPFGRRVSWPKPRFLIAPPGATGRSRQSDVEQIPKRQQTQAEYVPTNSFQDDHHEEVGHLDLAMASTPPPREDEHEEEESEHLSPDESDPDDPQFCNGCFSSRNWSTMIECSYCGEWVHLDCYNNRALEHDLQVLHGVPEGEFACKHDCFDKFLDRVKRNGPSLAFSHLELHAGTEEADIGIDGCFVDDEWDTSQGFRELDNLNSEPAAVPSLRLATMSLKLLASTKPMLYASICNWKLTYSAIPAETYHAVMDGAATVLARRGVILSANDKKALHEACPSLNIRRALTRCGDARIRTEHLVYSIRSKGVEVYFDFSFRSPVQAAIDLLDSSALRSCGPLWDPASKRCSTGRMPDLRRKVGIFSAVNDATLGSCPSLVIPIGLYSDESSSASRNVEFYPVWLANLMIDPDIRFVKKRFAHACLGLFPVMSGLRYRFVNASHGSPEQAEATLSEGQIKRALSNLHTQALQAILRDIHKIEDEGEIFTLQGVRTSVRLLVVWYSADMKERRMLLGMRQGVYDCTRCYAFPGRENAAEQPRGPRTVRTDEKIRKEFNDGYSSKIYDEGRTKSRADAFKEECGHLGIGQADGCVFTKD